MPFYCQPKNKDGFKFLQDLHQAVKSDSKKVIVIRKRQLKLYAGQPFEDVEMALHSLIENETAYT